MASTCCGGKLADLKMRWMTMAPTTEVIKEVQMRKASLYFRAVFGENSNMNT